MQRPAPRWPEVLARYQRPTTLLTRARRIPFGVHVSVDRLVVTPSTGVPRTIGERDFMRHWDAAAALVPGSVWRQTTRNSSYIEAVAADLLGVP